MLPRSASVDPDGWITAYSWNLGDGSPVETTPQVTHTYPATGSYSVTLTVTDNLGRTASVTKTVTLVPPPNQPPTAVFSASVNLLSVAFDGSGSSDADGTVSAYSWDFGDGTGSTKKAPLKDYAAAGTYRVTLTVTDDRGATGSVQGSVTVANVPLIASDAFGRTTVNGWGSADLGGAWTLSGSSANFSVDGSTGIARVPTAGGSVAAYLNGVSALDQDISLTYAVDKIADGGGSFLNVAARGGASNAYRAKIWIKSTGAVQAQAVTLVNGVQTTLATKDIAGLTVAPGTRLKVRVQTIGANPTTFAIKVWADGSPEPAGWAVSVSNSAAALQAPAGAGLMMVLSGSSTAAPLTFTLDDVQVAKPQ